MSKITIRIYLSLLLEIKSEYVCRNSYVVLRLKSVCWGRISRDTLHDFDASSTHISIIIYDTPHLLASLALCLLPIDGKLDVLEILVSSVDWDSPSVRGGGTPPDRRCSIVNYRQISSNRQNRFPPRCRESSSSRRRRVCCRRCCYSYPP